MKLADSQSLEVSSNHISRRSWGAPSIQDSTRAANSHPEDVLAGLEEKRLDRLPQVVEAQHSLGRPKPPGLTVFPGFILLTHDLLVLDQCGAPRGQTDSSLLTPLDGGKTISCRHLMCGRQTAPGSKSLQFRPGNCATLCPRHKTSAARLLRFEGKLANSGKCIGPPRQAAVGQDDRPGLPAVTGAVLPTMVPGRGRQRSETGSNSPR